MNEKVEVQIVARRLVVEMEDLTPIEINALAQRVSERLAELQSQNKAVADTSKLALLTALAFAADLERERAGAETLRRLVENRVDALSQPLRDALASLEEPAP